MMDLIGISELFRALEVGLRFQLGIRAWFLFKFRALCSSFSLDAHEISIQSYDTQILSNKNLRKQNNLMKLLYLKY